MDLETSSWTKWHRDKLGNITFLPTLSACYQVQKDILGNNDVSKFILPSTYFWVKICFQVSSFLVQTGPSSPGIHDRYPLKENKSYWNVMKIYSREWLVYKRGLEYLRNIFFKFEKTWISHKERFFISVMARKLTNET